MFALGVHEMSGRRVMLNFRAFLRYNETKFRRIFMNNDSLRRDDAKTTGAEELLPFSENARAYLSADERSESGSFASDSECVYETESFSDNEVNEWPNNVDNTRFMVQNIPVIAGYVGLQLPLPTAAMRLATEGTVPGYQHNERANSIVDYAVQSEEKQSGYSL